MIRAVLDANVLVSGFAFSGVPHGVLGRAGTSFQLVTSASILSEVADVLSREKIQRRAPSTPEERVQFITQLALQAELVRGLADVPIFEPDPKDTHILACVAESQPDYLVTVTRPCWSSIVTALPPSSRLAISYSSSKPPHDRVAFFLLRHHRHAHRTRCLYYGATMTPTPPPQLRRLSLLLTPDGILDTRIWLQRLDDALRRKDWDEIDRLIAALKARNAAIEESFRTSRSGRSRKG